MKTFGVLYGDGINCENETAKAFEAVGIKTKLIHVNELLENANLLDNVDGLAFPGGFSYGDELGSGQVLALKLRYKLEVEIKKFIENKKPIIGICNGFQILMKLGAFEGLTTDRNMGLAHNRQGHFINRWVTMSVPTNIKGPWFTHLKNRTIKLPMRHGEGRIVLNKSIELWERTFSYTEDVNGAHQNIAGLVDKTGLILGLMPHPEAAIYRGLFPDFNRNEENLMDHGDGYLFFKSIADYLNKKEI